MSRGIIAKGLERLHNNLSTKVMVGWTFEEENMLLAIDVGNTNTVLGIFRGSKGMGTWRIRTLEDATADEYWLMLHKYEQLESHRYSRH